MVPCKCLAKLFQACTLYPPTHPPTHPPTRTCTPEPPRTPSHTHTHTHTHTPARAHTHTLTPVNHTHAHTHKHAQKNKHDHTHTHTHKTKTHTHTHRDGPLEAAGFVCQQPEYGVESAAECGENDFWPRQLPRCIAGWRAVRPMPLASVSFPPLSDLSRGLRSHGPSSLGRVPPKKGFSSLSVSASNSCCKVCSFSWPLLFRTCHGWAGTHAPVRRSRLALMFSPVLAGGLQLRLSSTCLGKDLSGTCTHACMECLHRHGFDTDVYAAVGMCLFKLRLS